MPMLRGRCRVAVTIVSSDTAAGGQRTLRISRRRFLKTSAPSLAMMTLVPRGLAAGGRTGGRTTGRTTKVVLLLTGVINDGGWGELAYEGIERLRRDPRFYATCAEDVSLAQVQQVARGYSDDGFDLILGHGFEFSSALQDVAPDYPKQSYFVTSFLPAHAIPPNILFVNMGYFDASYAAGALAALISEKQKAVGFVGGADDPNQQRMKLAFVAGAQRTVPGIRGMGIITGDYDNAAKGREAASTLIGNGCDVLWHAADVTGLGAIEGVAQAAGRVKVMGCYSDQTALAPKNMATSFEMNLAGMVTAVADAVETGTFRGGTEWRPPVDAMWLLRAGTHGDYNPELVSAAAWGRFQGIWEELARGRIDVRAAVAGL
jgi:basic membrane protein A